MIHATDADDAKSRLAQLEALRRKLEETARRLYVDRIAHTKKLEERNRELATLTRILVDRDRELDAFRTERAGLTNERESLRAECARLANELDERNRERVMLTQTLADRGRELDALRTELEKLQREYAASVNQFEERGREEVSLRAELAERAHVIVRLEEQCKMLRTEQVRELAAKDRALVTEKQRLARIQKTLSWKLASPVRALERIFTRPPQEHEAPVEDDVKLITQAGLFDEAWYCGHYPEAAASGMSAVEHYVCHGAAEGKNPGPEFDTGRYLGANRDVADAQINPLVHYLRFGREEGRVAYPVERGKG